MDAYYMTASQLEAFATYLRDREKSAGTTEKYCRDAAAFARFLGGRPATTEAGADWKAALLRAGYAPVTVNSMLSALNAFCRFMGWDVRVRFVRIQRRLFREERRELSRAEYTRLLAAAQPRPRVRLLLETICSTGIRVSEVRYITVEAARRQRAEITLKGKVRVILLPDKLCARLLKFARAQKIASGEIFLTESGKSLRRQQIWATFKRLCAAARVAPEKVFPHNLRHLFAVTFENLLGVPVLCVPKLGVIYDTLKQPLGLCIVVFVVALIALVSVLTAPKEKPEGGKTADGNTGIPSSDVPIENKERKIGEKQHESKNQIPALCVSGGRPHSVGRAGHHRVHDGN